MLDVFGTEYANRLSDEMEASRTRLSVPSQTSARAHAGEGPRALYGSGFEWALEIGVG